MQGQIKAKLKAINLANPIEALKNFLKVRPVNVRDKAIISQDLEGFHLIVSKIPEKQHNNLLQALTEKQCELVLDYLHRFMQFVGDSEANVVTGPLLSLYDKIVAKHGPSIIINTVSRSDSLVSRIVNY